MEKLLLVNFGGPRDLNEVYSFLKELLSDQELLRTPFPPFLHRLLFSYVAKKRSKKIAKDYEEIGGKSPIYFDTEVLREELEKIFNQKILTFHRYLPNTHEDSLEAIEKEPSKEILVFPFFPQFSTATTGSIATFFHQRLSSKSFQKLRWIRSYPEHPSFVTCYKKRIETLMEKEKILEKDCYLLFSAHGVPLSFIQKGDSYEKECIASFQAISSFFPQAKKVLSYQSKFGPGKWLEPSTETIASTLDPEDKKWCIIVPLSFTSDHIETLFEIEKLYVPLLKNRFSQVLRCPSFNQDPDWLLAIYQLIDEVKKGKSRLEICPSFQLLRKKTKTY